jgi:hypothetical protein
MGSATYKMLLTLGPSDPETDTPARFLCAANESGPAVPLLGRLLRTTDYIGVSRGQRDRVLV